MINAVNELVDKWSNPILWVVTSRSGTRQGGLIATFVSKASLVPELPRFVVGVAKHHFTWSLIQESQALALHVVGDDQMPWIERFGIQSGKSGIDKLEGIATQTGSTGSPILPEALLWMDCKVEAALDTGDRTLFLTQVVAAGAPRPGQPARLIESMSRLTAEQKSTCQHQMAHDIQIDTAAIEAWRAAVTHKI